MKRLFFNRALRVLLLTNSLILVAAAMLGPIYALFVEEIGGDLLDASFAGALFALAAGLTTLISGKYADKIRHDENIVLLGYSIIGLSFFAYLFVNSIWTLLIVQVTIGIGEAIYTPAFDALYSKHLDVRKLGQEWGAWESLNYFSTAAGSVIGGLLVTYLGFSGLFITMSALCLLSAFYIFTSSKRVFR